MHLSITIAIILPHGKNWRVDCPSIWLTFTPFDFITKHTSYMEKGSTTTGCIFSKKYALCHSVFCHIINAFPCVLKDVDIIFLVFNQLELTNLVNFCMLICYMIAYKMYENDIIFSISAPFSKKKHLIYFIENLRFPVSRQYMYS